MSVFILPSKHTNSFKHMDLFFDYSMSGAVEAITPLHKLDIEPIQIHDATAQSLSINPTLVLETGREGSNIEHLSYKGRSMAVFTSGGDSSGLINYS